MGAAKFGRERVRQLKRGAGGRRGHWAFVCLFVLELTGSAQEENIPAAAAAAAPFSDLPNRFLPHVSFFGFLPSTVWLFFRRRFESPLLLGATSGPARATGGDSND